MTLYNLRKTELGFRITKFDSDLNVSSSYNVSMIACECPQGHKPTCRHRKMLPIMIDRVDTAWFWHYDEGQWKDPTGEASDYSLRSKGDALRAIPGVTVVDIGNPEALNSAIAETVGEPIPQPSSGITRR